MFDRNLVKQVFLRERERERERERDVCVCVQTQTRECVLCYGVEQKSERELWSKTWSSLGSRKEMNK